MQSSKKTVVSNLYQLFRLRSCLVVGDSIIQINNIFSLKNKYKSCLLALPNDKVMIAKTNKHKEVR